MIQGRTIGSTREGLLTSKFAVQSSQDVYRIMGKHKVNKQKILSVDDGFKNSACATENLLEPLRSKVHKQQNDPTSINHTDHNQSTDKMNVLNHSDKNQKRKRKHSSLYDAQNEDTLGDQDIFQNINVFESQVDKTVISKKLPKSKKRKKQHSSQLNVSNESTSTESNRIELIDDTEIKLKSGKLKRKHSSVKNGEDENSFKDHNASNESSEVNCEVEVVPKSKKRKHNSLLRNKNPDVTLTETVTNECSKNKAQDNLALSHNYSKLRKFKQHDVPKTDMRKWYHDEEIPVDEEYFTSDESANEMDASKSRSLQRSHRRASNEQLMRTLFIGNLPPNITKKRIEKLFNNVLKNDKVVSSNCRVESVRFRGAIPITGGTSKLARKRAAIKGEFSGVSTFRMGYVVLTSKVGVQVALSLNGYCLNSDGFIINPEESNKLIDSDTVNSVNNNCIYHIRVDRVTENKTKQKLDDCVFLGNLPFDCTEEEIHNVLSSLGTLSNVRLVRDSQTGAVRGFGYATFTDPSIIPLAIRASNTLSVRGRQIRICEWKMKKSKKNNKNKHFYQLNSTDKKMINTHPKKNMKNKSGKKRTDKKKQGKSLMKNKTKK